MANTSNSDKWYFTKEQLESTPSRKAGFDALKELSYRQQAANFIQDMGQRLKVSQLCINTAIVYMHRFYVFHSFTNFPWHQMAAAALFLAAKVEEQPRKLEYVIRVANLCRNPRDTNFDINSERYISQSQDLVFNENVLLQTLGFDVAIDHPHTYVVRCCHLVRASKDLAQSSYFMASNSLHLTTMCLQYKPTVVACFCIMVACKWSNWEIPLSIEKKEWFTYVDSTVTAELLQQLTSEFLTIFENCPSRLKKIMAFSDADAHLTPSHSSSPFDQDPKKIKEDSKDYRPPDRLTSDEPHKHRSRPQDPTSSQAAREQREREYKERKERERLAGQKALMSSSGKPVPHALPKHPADPKLKPHHSKPPYPQSASRVEPRDILREATRDSPFGLAKEVQQKRDYLLKPNVQEEISGGYRVSESNRSHVRSKHESSRRHEEQKQPYLKQETDNIKKHINASLHEKNNAYLKSNVDVSKSVPKVPSNSTGNKVFPPPRTHHHNGSTNGSLPMLEETKLKQEPIVKEEIPTPAIIKRPSLFSPKCSPTYNKKQIKPEIITPVSQCSLTPLSPIMSPELKRSDSMSSEPELRPVMKKIDQVEGFENLMRDNTIGIGEINNEPEPAPEQQIKTDPEEYTPTFMEAPPLETKSAIMNGLETNPTVISNLLKEAPTVPHLSSISAPAESSSQAESVSVIGEQPKDLKDKDHHHHKSKKKKEKHKHKDKDKSKEEKEKKKKHKDKDRERHKHKEKSGSREREAPVAVVEAQPMMPSEPIKIKIQKERIKVPSPDLPPVTSSGGLKIKIPKDKIKTESIGEPSILPLPSGGSLKIKISKEVIANCTPQHLSDTPSKKRDRQSLSNDHQGMPPAKMARGSGSHAKQNGRHHHHGKVAHCGDGDLSAHRVPESKYAKGSS